MTSFDIRRIPGDVLYMLLILNGNSEHVVHARKQENRSFGEKEICFVTDRDLIKLN